MQAQEARSHASGVRGHAPLDFFVKNSAISAFWCILGPILAFKILLFLRVFYFVFLNVAFADKSENKEKRRTLNVI